MQKMKTPYMAWLTCALFFLLQYTLRVTPNVMMQDLRNDFLVNADEYATLGSYYLYAYALSQIPLGFLIDRFGIRRITLISMFLCIFSLVLSANATAFLHLKLARILVGCGSGVAFTGALKIASDAFPPEKRGVLMGLTLTFGTIGALTAGKPLVTMLETTGWRDTFLLITVCFVPLLFLAVFSLPSRQRHDTAIKTETDTFQTLKFILSNKYILIYTALAIGLYTPLSSLADLWGTAFLMKKYDFTLSTAATANTMMYLGMAIGSLGLGAICTKKNTLNLGIQLSGIGLLFITTIVVLGPVLPFSLTSLILIGMGFFCGAEMLCFSGASLHTTPQTSGLTLGFVNTLNMLGGAVLQQFIGFGLDMQWSGGLTSTGVREYSLLNYTNALLSLIVIIGLCVFLSFFLKRSSPHHGIQGHKET